MRGPNGETGLPGTKGVKGDQGDIMLEVIWLVVYLLN